MFIILQSTQFRIQLTSYIYQLARMAREFAPSLWWYSHCTQMKITKLNYLLFFFRWCFPYFWLPSLCPSLWSLLSRWRFEQSKIVHDSITKKNIFDCCKNVGLRSCLATSTKLKSYLRFLLKGGAGVWASSDVQVVTNFENIYHHSWSDYY